MEQLYCAVREDEEEEEEQQLLQDGAALKGRQSLQQGKDGSITNAEAPSFFSSVGKQFFPQKEEVLHTHKEHTEQPAQKVEETNNVVAENGSNFNDDSEKGGNGIIAEIVENVINGEALSSATINADAPHHKNSVYFDQQQGMWKCHHCSWTKQFDSPWNLRRGNLNGYSDLLMNVKTMIQHGRCIVCETKGDASSEDSIADPASIEDSRIDNPLEIAQNSHSSLMKEAQSPEQSFDSEVVANDVARDKQNFIVNGSIPSIEDLKKVETGIEDEIKPSVAKEENEELETSTSQAAYVPTEGATVTEAHTEIYIGEQPRAEIGEHREWEILKSIVYGGLVESITSLGVVSSAASSGAAPLNIIALGLANLIGGLSVIGHNLTDLKNGHSGGNPSQERYEELLGRRENFTLHAFLAVLSFIIFGSVPLVVYGLLISKHYSDEYNIAAVTASSVVCIILLAMGKAYISTPTKSYIKTVLHYVSLALATSGVTYIAGDLAKDLLDKISGSESGYVLAMPLSDTRMEPA